MLKHINFDVDRAFIKQFYEIQKNKSEYNVDLDTVADWLGADVDNLIRTLKHSYEENEDYIVRLNAKPKKKDLGGSEKKSYFLTSDCFKEVALSSKAKNGVKVKKYYIKLEKLVDRYKDEILELYKHEREINKLNNRVYPERPGVYVIRETKIVNNKNQYRYKLGRTNNLKERMAVYNTGSSDNVDLAFFTEILNHVLVEKCVKNGLTPYVYKKNKEFYDCSIQKIRDMIHSCVAFHDNKLFRPSSNGILQIQFTFTNSNFDPDETIHFMLDDHDPEDEKEPNMYEDHWTADDVDIFKDVEISFEQNDDDHAKKGGCSRDNKLLYEQNKRDFIQLSRINRSIMVPNIAFCNSLQKGNKAI